MYLGIIRRRNGMLVKINCDYFGIQILDCILKMDMFS